MIIKFTRGTRGKTSVKTVINFRVPHKAVHFLGFYGTINLLCDVKLVISLVAIFRCVYECTHKEKCI
jgi:hypothetical protein